MSKATGEPVGRPEIQVDMEDMKKWARAGCTVREIAQKLGVACETLENRLRRPEYREAFDQGRAEMIISLRSKQVQLALGGNVTMLIWLGKQFLGQKDRHEHSGTGPNGEIMVQTEAKDQLKAEFDAINAKLSGANSPTPTIRPN